MQATNCCKLALTSARGVRAAASAGRCHQDRQNTSQPCPTESQASCSKWTHIALAKVGRLLVSYGGVVVRVRDDSAKMGREALKVVQREAAAANFTPNTRCFQPESPTATCVFWRKVWGTKRPNNHKYTCPGPRCRRAGGARGRPRCTRPGAVSYTHKQSVTKTPENTSSWHRVACEITAPARGPGR